ncbi:MAG: c-type cytochrome, partial [Geminicoccaceae bacterium]
TTAAFAGAAEQVEAAAETATDTEAVAEKATDMVAGATADAGDAAAEAVDTAASAAESASKQVAETTEQVTGAVTAAATGAAGGVGEASGLVAMIASADLAKGEKVSKKCKACHVFDEGGKHKLGPALWGIVGRDIASYDGFNYSGALNGLEGDWTFDKLDQFLAAPKKFLPGTKMVFAGVKKEQDRADLILYLRSLAAEPAPLAEGG